MLHQVGVSFEIKFYLIKPNEAARIVCRIYAACLLRRGVCQKGDVSALLTVTDIQKALPNGLVNGQSEVPGRHRKL